MTYRVGIVQRQNAVDGWVFDLLGCRAIGGSRDDVMTLLPAVIAEHLVWLRQHGEPAGDPSEVGFEVVEELASNTEFVFQDDLAPLTPEELETGLRRSSLAFADLLERGRLPDAILDWRPPVSAVKIEFFPDVRSVRQMLEHASGSSGFFTRNLGNGDWTPPTVSSPDDVPALREAVFARMRSLSPAELAQVYRRPDRVRGGDAEWTARKLVRRLVNHERFHMKEIEQRLSWLLLAVPDVMPVSRE